MKNIIDQWLEDNGDPTIHENVTTWVELSSELEKHLTNTTIEEFAKSVDRDVETIKKWLTGLHPFTNDEIKLIKNYGLLEVKKNVVK